MPGILPMKVIKMGTTANMRIAQACDRCRSKKIRCDGIRPCCTQCSAVGFECKTSDKLSRRAFPRGYTESLEERVRSLETEVKELKELLDEKDEKIDMLGRIQGHRPSLPGNQSSLAQLSPPLSSRRSSESVSEHDDDVTFKVQQLPYLTQDAHNDSYFIGTSSGTSFIESFKQKVQEKGRSTTDVRSSQLLKTAAQQKPKPIVAVLSASQSRPPPRLLADQLVNIFFQEWAPLFPILHRPTFLSLYEQFTSAPESITDKKSIAQLYLVFSLAALSQGSQHNTEIASFQVQWQSAIQAIQMEQSLGSLQCLLLAQLFCMQKGDCSQLISYKALAVSLSARLGLHQSQKRFALGTLTCETRKKVFWTLYTLDSFSAIMLGLPQQVKDAEVFCEFPVDADDEYITEQGFQPLLPGESTRVSSALALFRAAQILSRVIDQCYPALPSFELSLRKITALSDDLDQWQASLAPHLRLPFAQDKPTVGTVSSRSPLLSLTYHYIRTLIHRPAVSASIDSSTSSSSIAMAGSCKSIAQILQLLTERGLSFSFCMNKEDLLVLSGFGLLMQSLDLESSSRVLRDNQKTLAMIIGQLDLMKAVAAQEFRNVTCSFLTPPSRASSNESLADASKNDTVREPPSAQPISLSGTVKQQFKVVTSKLSRPSKATESIKEQRQTAGAGPTPYRQSSYVQSQPVPSNSEADSQSQSGSARSSFDATAVSPTVNELGPIPFPASHPLLTRQHTNLDYLSFHNAPATVTPNMYMAKPQPTDWERLLATIDNGQANIFDNIYGGPPVDVLRSSTMPCPLPIHSTTNLADGMLAWDPNLWAVTGADLNALASTPHIPESVLSLSTDDGSGSRSGLDPANIYDEASSIHEADRYRGFMVPDLAHSDDGLWDPGFEPGYAALA